MATAGLRSGGRWRAGLDSLFPESPPAPVTGASVGLVLVALALGTVLSLARQSGVGALHTLYAEDGQISLAQALHESPGRALTTPYVGYFHVLPRLVAEVAAAVPVRNAPAVLAGLSALLVAGIGLLVHRASAGHIRLRAVRVLLGASVVLVPVAQDEVLNNVANLHWYFMFASAWVLLWKAEANWELALGSIVVFLTALSDPITAVLLPLAAVRLLGIKGWRNQLFTLALVAGVALQLGAVVVSHAQRTGLSPSFNVPKLIGWYGFFVVARAVGGMRAIDELGSRGAQLLAALAGGIAVGVAVVAVRARCLLRPVVLVLLLSSALFYFVPVMPTGATPARYTVAPLLLLFSAAACVADGLAGGPRSTRIRLAGVAVVVLLVVIWGSNFRVPNARSTSRHWSEALAEARATCQGGRSGYATVAITPPGWHITLPCAVADSSRPG